MYPPCLPKLFHMSLQPKGQSHKQPSERFQATQTALVQQHSSETCRAGMDQGSSQHSAF
jgi:hypothetical protein